MGGGGLSVTLNKQIIQAKMDGSLTFQVIQRTEPALYIMEQLLRDILISVVIGIYFNCVSKYNLFIDKHTYTQQYFKRTL